MNTNHQLDTRQRVIEIIAEVCFIDKSAITSGATLQADLGIDSVDTVSLVLALEDEFGGTIPDEDIERLSTVEDIISYIGMKSGGTG